MKRYLSALICALLLASLSPAAFAADSKDTEFEVSLAYKLNELGLFRGVAENEDATVSFELEREPTRIEALIMLVRALGKGAEAEACTKTHPFTDVPSWADGYVSYAYDHGIAKGLSDTLFDADSKASAEVYLTFMLRALGYSDNNGGDFSWETPWALAAWCGICPTRVEKTPFLRDDAVDVTCAALYAYIKGTQTTLHERLSAQGAFTKEQFDSAFPADPFAEDRLIAGRISEIIKASVPLGVVDHNVYASACHYIADMAESDGVLTVSALVCYGRYTLYENGYLNGSSSVAPWLIRLAADTLQPVSCRPAYEFREEGLELKDCFSEKTLVELDLLRMPMRAVCEMQTRTQIDSGLFTYRQPIYEEMLLKARSSFSEVIQTLETEGCTILLGRISAGPPSYRVEIIFKPGSSVGEGETEQIRSSSEGYLSLSEDGSTLNYSYHFVDRAIGEALSPLGHASLPESGICSYTIDLNTKDRSWRITPD